MKSSARRFMESSTWNVGNGVAIRPHGIVDWFCLQSTIVLEYLDRLLMCLLLLKILSAIRPGWKSTLCLLKVLGPYSNPLITGLVRGATQRSVATWARSGGKSACVNEAVILDVSIGIDLHTPQVT